MKKSRARGGAAALMIVSIVILAASAIVTLVFALRARQDGDVGVAPDGESVLESDARPAGPQQTPDWVADEAELDALAAQLSAAPQNENDPEPSPEPSAPTEPEPFVNPFSDVKESDYFFAPVMWAAQQKIVSGETFSPAAVCTRAQAITFLWRQQGEPEPRRSESPFSDVSAGDYYFKPALWAFEAGLISAPSDGRFKPDDAVNRAQAVTFLYRVCGGSAEGLTNPYNNVGPGDYYYESALWAFSRGIVILDSGEYVFDAAGICTRAQYVTFLYRCFAAEP